MHTAVESIGRDEACIENESLATPNVSAVISPKKNQGNHETSAASTVRKPVHHQGVTRDFDADHDETGIISTSSLQSAAVTAQPSPRENVANVPGSGHKDISTMALALDTPPQPGILLLLMRDLIGQAVD